MQVRSAERRSRLRKRRFERAEIANPRSASRGLEHHSVKFDNLTEREVAHSSEPLVQIAAFLDDAACDELKLLV